MTGGAPAIRCRRGNLLRLAPDYGDCRVAVAPRNDQSRRAVVPTVIMRTAGQISTGSFESEKYCLTLGVQPVLIYLQIDIFVPILRKNDTPIATESGRQ
jgi:hypothetical protein